MKTCTKCKIEKELTEFSKDKNSKDNLKSACKKCLSIESKIYYNKNKEKESEKAKNYYIKNKEKIDLKHKEYKENNKDKIKEYREKNKEKINLRHKKYYENNKENLLEYQKNHRQINKEKINEKRKIYDRKKRQVDFLFKSKKNIKCLIRNSFKIRGYNNQSRIYEILGCSYDEFKIYIESQFEPWMNWNNHGLYNGELNYGWDIDHIIPLSSAKTEEEILRLNHYTNLRPLCSKINRYIKKDSLDFF
jgi:hypothetical protein